MKNLNVLFLLTGCLLMTSQAQAFWGNKYTKHLKKLTGTHQMQAVGDTDPKSCGEVEIKKSSSNKYKIYFGDSIYIRALEKKDSEDIATITELPDQLTEYAVVLNVGSRYSENVTQKKVTLVSDKNNNLRAAIYEKRVVTKDQAISDIDSDNTEWDSDDPIETIIECVNFF